ncbi:HAS3 [Branchiostoma lanceolatum]|uniref:chitin synthase n=1 Tax=Branchiostoma lanceolatum TaxID=7740 RepID=A0A8J9ZCZ1_BRALA|nr:HAS3 [Branchiostoma lanceolatum]
MHAPLPPSMQWLVSRHTDVDRNGTSHYQTTGAQVSSAVRGDIPPDTLGDGAFINIMKLFLVLHCLTDTLHSIMAASNNIELHPIPERGPSSGTTTARIPAATNSRENGSKDTSSDRCRTAMRLGAVTFVFLVVLACSVVCKLSLFYLEVKLFNILNPPVTTTSTNATNFTTEIMNFTTDTMNFTTASMDTTTAIMNTTVGSMNFTAASMNLTTDSMNDTSCDPEDLTEETVVIWLSLILVIPYVITFLRCVWISLMNWNYEPNPSRRHIVLGALFAMLEVLSMASLLLRALPASPSVGIILVNSVFMFAVLTKSCSSFRNNGGCQRKIKPIIKGVVFFSLFCVMLAGLILTVMQNQYWSEKVVWDTVASLVLLALCWTPVFQKFTALTEENTVHPEEKELGSSSGPIKTQNNTACWKLGIVTNLVKCLVWAVCVFVFYPVMKGQNPLDVSWRIIPLCSGESYAVFAAFLANVSSGVFGFGFAILAMKMRMQNAGFLAPIVVSNIAVSLLLILGIHTPLCSIMPAPEFGPCTQKWDLVPILGSTLMFVFGMCVQVSEVRGMPTIVMEKDSNLLWTPGYNSVLLDQWLLLTRRTDLPRQNEERTTPTGTETTRVFICTTMYHESNEEMKQLLDSIWDMAKTQTEDRKRESKVEFEAHIFFDDGFKNGQVQDFALQLLSIIDGMNKGGSSLIESCEKWHTPYGLQLQWRLPSAGGAGDGGMTLTLHLKDNTKVKNKKRWSQVMYMSYVLNHVLGSPEPNGEAPSDCDTYILATDADVKFTPESAMALLDLARRDPTVGAVCGRTHPLGSGPMVWYQKFDYAVGHWYQKTANSVLGSVLCCPGCFSVYRAEALREALGTYSGGVSEAREFLMKDMGEDRWLCTLMVSNGWRLEYTAVSEDSTYCPEEFAEFYNQRRRWGPSTVANQGDDDDNDDVNDDVNGIAEAQIELLEKYFGHEMRRDSVSFLFMVYQGLLFFSGLIGPATCILIIAGGLQFFNSVHDGTADAQAEAQTVSLTIVIILSLVSLLYGLICLCASKKFQLKMAMFLSLCFAVLMTLVLVSLIEDTVVEFQTMIENLNADESYTPSISTLYFLALVGMYVITGLVHFTEFPNLLYGVVYFLSLPTGYILLTIYSVCNLTDRTWGTREGRSSAQPKDKSMAEMISDFFTKICVCFPGSNYGHGYQPLPQSDKESEPQNAEKTADSTAPQGEDDRNEDTPRRRKTPVLPKSRPRGLVEEVATTGRARKRTVHSMTSGVRVDNWLSSVGEQVFVNYARNFEDNGYEDESFLAGMTDEDLKRIGIDEDFHRAKLLRQIRTLTEFELETAVPDDATDWLKKLNLIQYIDKFRGYGISTRADLALLLKMDLDKLMLKLNITKQGHITRLKAAVDAMKEPDEMQKEKYQVKRIFLRSNIVDLKAKRDGRQESAFWEKLRKEKLSPDLGMFTSDVDLKQKLIGLRNSALVVLLVVNVLWITIMMVLSSRPALQVLGQNPMGFLSLAVFGLVQVIQFLAMLYHRLITLLHAVARL